MSLATKAAGLCAALLAGRSAAVSLERNPGAGMNPEAITPFKDFHKDGFAEVACLKDSMLEHGDKHGDGKFSYKLGDVSNVSILHYTDMVPKEDQKPMTHGVCYSFCRTVPMMNFFGITNGRDCYCAPYYKQMAGDSSQCDTVCDGDQTTMCGGKTKSTIFSMHSCNDDAAKLSEATAAAVVAEKNLTAIASKVDKTAKDMQAVADALQPVFGKAGDSVAAGNLQDAKKFAGELEHAAADGTKLAAELAALPRAAGANVALTERVTSDLTTAAQRAEVSTEQLGALAQESEAPDGKGNEKLYYPVMYFADKDFTEVPTTCGGTAAAKPILGSLDGCAEACEKAGSLKCKGFSYMAGATGGLCFLLSEVSAATYYTGCSSAFLQTRDPAGTKCMLKFSAFEGTTIKPDGSGKCKECLKELTKADRCPK
eukprot:TRINITY_DN1921_c0_g1_i1.p1 TRINITY_DN1921_c0_g1~~TRINITY_DN1921_c0_g1_i1.p1  ORF type:complete len:427 (+),score=132.67 TRINITY_DN1921_c0_g1_i1:81-1361(+)